MSRESLTKKKSFDWITLSVFFSLVTIGWFMVFSTLYDPKNQFAFLDVTTLIGAQSLWVVLSMLAFFSVLTLDWKFWNTLAYPIYAIGILFLILVLIFGDVINGARAWFSFGFFSIQPSEWAKFGTALALSSYLSFFKTSVTTTNVLAVSLAIFLGPALLILLQPDFGSALIFFSFFILLYRRGMSPWVIIIGIGIAAIFIYSLIFTPLDSTALLVFLAGTIFAFDMEKPVRALIIATGVLAAFIGMKYIPAAQSYFFVPAAAMFGYYLFLEIKKSNARLVSLVVPVMVFASVFAFGSRSG